MTADLNLAPIGNCAVTALIDANGRMVWGCLPRVDSDPVFSNLLSGVDAGDPEAKGVWAVVAARPARVSQAYLRNTPILRTEVEDETGAIFEILDFAPRQKLFGRTFRPPALARLIRPVKGAPRISVRFRPMRDWGAESAPARSGSSHVAYTASDMALRLTTSGSVSAILDERVFRLEEPLALYLGPDETFEGDVLNRVEGFLAATETYWREWVRTLVIPLDFQTEVIRAAITLKLCVYEETGAIVAAMTTSIPEFPSSGRNWDYRYCWIRDAYYVVQALTRLGAMDILENYLGYIRNIVDAADGGHIQPLYGVGMEANLTEATAPHLPGYRGMGPVRIGNQAAEHLQNDVYGQIVLSTIQAFFDERLIRPAERADFDALERIAEQAVRLHDQPDAGLWELRTRAHIHTYSAAMCWAACDRMARAARRVGLDDRAEHWSERAALIRSSIETRAFVASENRFSAVFDEDIMDASLLQLVDLGFLEPDDSRHRDTLKAVETALRRGNNLFRYVTPDDFGEPEAAFNFCTFWFIEALYRDGRTQDACELFQEMLGRRNHVGLLSEDIGLEDGALWGNFPQTYSLVGLINCASLLSRPWSHAR
jgi:GH15 family glucan-1,4-alpha-glucosidase